MERILAAGDAPAPAEASPPAAAAAATLVWYVPCDFHGCASIAMREAPRAGVWLTSVCFHS